MLSKAFSRALFPALFLLVALPAFSDSAVRIVRLSYIENDVQIDRGTGKYEKAMVNLPITAGTKLETGSNGLAEVEFEDESTIRLAPDTTLQITQLSLRESGEKVSTAEVVNGTAYVNFAGTQKSGLTLQFGSDTIVLARSARLRISIDPKAATVAVFKGNIQVNGPSGTKEVKKKETAKLELSQEGTVTLVKSIEQGPYDEWEKKQDKYHSHYASTTYDGSSSYRYGLADLAYYGNFFSAPGYGMLWQPYFSGMGWNPFMDGAWVVYPGRGYTWVSAYPWGWTPFHCGTWVFLSGYGWAWQPGGVWTNWSSQPTLLHPPAGFTVPRPPTVGTTTMVVNRVPTVTMTTQSPGRLAVRTNSAGLGVPRGEVRNLARISERVQDRPIAAHTFNAPGTQPPVAYRGDIHSAARSSQVSTPVMHAPAASAPAHASTAVHPHR